MKKAIESLDLFTAFLLKVCRGESNMNEKRKEIYDGFVLEQNQKIEDYKSELINKNQENAKQQHQEFKNVLNNLENLYNSNKDKWINEIVERCLK